LTDRTSTPSLKHLPAYETQFNREREELNSREALHQQALDRTDECSTMKKMILALGLALATTAANADGGKCGSSHQDRLCQARNAQEREHDGKSHKKHHRQHHRNDNHTNPIVDTSKPTPQPAPRPTPAPFPVPAPAPILSTDPTPEPAPQPDPAECLTDSVDCDPETAQAQDLSLAANVFSTQAISTRPLNPPAISPAIWGVNLEGYTNVDSLAHYYSYIVPQATLASLTAKALRFPGGCPGDTYDWRTATIGGMTSTRRPFLSVDAALTLAQNAGAELIYTLNLTQDLLNQYPNPKPATINPCGDLPTFNGTLEQAKALVVRYRGRIRVYELANEPWYPFSAAQYRPVAEAYARAIKAIDANAQVMVAGFSRTGNNQDPNSPQSQYVTAWNQMVHGLLGLRCATPAGTKPCFDTVQIHPYFLSGYEPTAGWAIPDKDRDPTTDRFQVMRQVLQNQAGTVSYFRQCPISFTLGVRGDYCTGWWERDLNTLRGVGHESYGAYAEWIEPKSTGDVFGQQFVARDGRHRWLRTCPANGDGIDVSRCSGFIEQPPYVGSYAGFAQYFVMMENSPWWTQSYLSSDGHTGQYRSCPVLASGVDFANCHPFAHVDLADLRGFGNERYSFTSVMTLRKSGGDRALQVVGDADGKGFEIRNCPMDNTNGIRFGECSGPAYWGHNDLTSTRGVGSEAYSAMSLLSMPIYMRHAAALFPANFPGRAAYLGVLNMPRLFDHAAADFGNVPVSLSEWNIQNWDGSSPHVPSINTAEHALFVAESLFVMMERGAVVGNLHDLPSIVEVTRNPNLTIATARLRPQGQALALTSTLAGGFKFDTDVVTPQFAVPATSCVSLACLKGGENAPYVSVYSGYAPTIARGQRDVVVYVINRHPTAATSVEVYFHNFPRTDMMFKRTVTARILSAPDMTAKTMSIRDVKPIGNSILVPPISITRVTYALTGPGCPRRLPTLQAICPNGDDGLE
jgi:hypothetical protein